VRAQAKTPTSRKKLPEWVSLIVRILISKTDTSDSLSASHWSPVKQARSTKTSGVPLLQETLGLYLLFCRPDSITGCEVDASSVVDRNEEPQFEVFATRLPNKIRVMALSGELAFLVWKIAIAPIQTPHLSDSPESLGLDLNRKEMSGV
jgi:hypothetical protein